MKIAIQGHLTKGKEVIQILESLGGKNTEELTGTFTSSFYYINDKNEICDDREYNFPTIYKFYTLEEFEKEFPFKVGDKVITSESCIGVIEKLIPGNISAYYVKINNIGGGYWCTPSSLRLYKKMKEERNITLTLEKAKEWYKKGGELKEVALQAYSEEELNKIDLPKTWEEFCENYPVKAGEFYIDTFSEVHKYSESDESRDIEMDKNICPSKKSAEAHLAMMQLEQLRDCWRNGWKPTWDLSEKWCICLCGNELSISISTIMPRFLTFPTKEIAKKFLECFRDLIEKAGDLI